jgi:hypothetical protein
MQKLLQRLLCLSLLLLSLMSKAEGTKEVSPNEANITALATLPTSLSGSYFGCPKDNRIYFSIKNFNTERFYCGFRPHFYQISPTSKPAANWCADSIYMKIFDTAGVLLFTQKLDTTSTGGKLGFIDTYAQAMAGPNIGSTTTGYTPLSYTLPKNGDFYIELFYSHDGGVTSDVTNNGWLKFPYFDLTVATTTNTVIPGRVFCSKWGFVAISNNASLAGGISTTSRFLPSALASSEAVFFSYNKDSVVTKVDFEPGFRPIAYNFAVNDYGVANTGNWLVDRQSRNDVTAPSLLGGYKIFLNDPDVAVYPSGNVPTGATFPAPTVKGCPGGTMKLRYRLPAAADVTILLDINGTTGYQPATSDRLIEQPLRPAGTNFYIWDGKDGQGITLSNNSTFTFSVSTYFQKGKASVPLYDAEINKAGFKIVGIRPVATAALRMFWDDSQLSNVALCAATAAATLSTSNLTGTGLSNTVTGSAAPAHAWNGTGNVAQTLPAPTATLCASATANDANTNTYQWDDFGNVRTINTWAYGIESFMTKTVVLQCINVSGTVFNDADGSAGGAFTNILTGTEAGTNAGTLYAAIIDPETREVIAFAVVNTNGTYTINGIAVNSTGLQVVITSTLPVVDAILPAETMPTGWLNTTPSLNTFNTGIVDINGLDFGLNRLPESAVNVQNSLLNPGSTNNVTAPANAFVTSNVGTNPSTLDYDGGTVTSIRITAFPSNVNSITINNIQYGTCGTCTAWPVGGVTVPYTTGVGPTQTITFDPIDGPISVVIPFAAIDNSGKEDPTPGSVTFNFTSILAIDNLSFNVSKINNKTAISFSTTEDATGSTFIIERSIKGSNFNEIGNLNGTTSLKYNFTDANPIANERNYYRIKEVNNIGKVNYTNVKVVSYSTDGKIIVYPIPASTEINIVLNDALQLKPLTVKIYNTQGTAVINKIINKAKSTETFNVNALPSGVYNISVGNDSKSIITKKIIVIK